MRPVRWSVFFAIDKDGSGTLEPHELKKAFEGLEAGLRRDDQSAIKALDTDNDGISLEEWKMLAWVMSSAA